MPPKTVAEAMTSPVIAFAPDTGLRTVARMFLDLHISGAPIVDPTGKPLGMVSKTDLIDPDKPRGHGAATDVFYRLAGGPPQAERASGPTGGTPGPGTASDVMMPFSFTVGPQSALLDAAKLMAADDIHRVLVMDGQRVVGILSTMNVIRGLLLP